MRLLQARCSMCQSNRSPKEALSDKKEKSLNWPLVTAGGVGALKAMGALDMGVGEVELPGLVNSWRGANPRIVQFWWDIDAAALKAVRERILDQGGANRP